MEFLKNLAIPSVSFPPTTLSSRVCPSLQQPCHPEWSVAESRDLGTTVSAQYSDNA